MVREPLEEFHSSDFVPSELVAFILPLASTSPRIASPPLPNAASVAISPITGTSLPEIAEVPDN